MKLLSTKFENSRNVERSDERELSADAAHTLVFYTCVQKISGRSGTVISTYAWYVREGTYWRLDGPNFCEDVIRLLGMFHERVHESLPILLEGCLLT